MSDLDEQMHGVDDVPFRDDWDAVQERAGQAGNPGRPAHRLSAGLVAAAVGIAAIGVAYLAFGNQDRQSASTGDPGYSFSDVTYRQDAQGWTTEYTINWIGDTWPGDHHCEVSVSGADGEVLKTQTSEFQGLQNGVGMTIDTRDQPTGFQAMCGPRLDTPVAYTISGPRTTMHDGLAQVEFTATPPADLSPGEYVSTNQCVAALVKVGKVVTANVFTLTVRGETRAHAWPGEHPGSVTQADTAGTAPIVQCEPFQSEASMQRMLADFRASSEAQGSPSDSADASPTSGPALAEALGLQELTRNEDGEINQDDCKGGVVAFDGQDGPVYCLDAALDFDSPTLALDKELLFRQLAGEPPLTDAQLRELQSHLDGDGSDSPAPTP